MPRQLPRFSLPQTSGKGWTTRVLATAIAGTCVSLVSLSSAGCLRRPAGQEEPTTKISFEKVVPQPAIEKIDLLLMVDNSGSMADKQKILANAVPDLVNGLVRPKCVDKLTRKATGVQADPTKPDAEQCPAGSEAAFTPITDMHIGVISSSLGGMGGSQCGPEKGGHQNDRGHLLARGSKGDVKAAGDLHFLAWYPDVDRNRDKDRHPDPPVPKIGTVDELNATFRDLIVGVGQDGCGLEAQLESVYHFLVQPDPWTDIDKTADGAATYGPKERIDVELLKQRAAFLRPDSLVAIVVLSDEDDSSADPLAFQGTGWQFMDKRTVPRATGACASDPTSKDCTSCEFSPNAPGCQPKLYSEAEDQLNVRFHHMKQRFGVDPQFPIQRYVDALTKPRVPMRDKEHAPGGIYAPTAGCTNPLFAAKLPTSENENFCTLPRGPRSQSLIYFAHIGGVPNSLLPKGTDPEEKIDWTPILGRDPAKWDETGINPHMIQSSKARKDLPPPTAKDDADPIHGREWSTDDKDLQFACTFDLYDTDASGQAVPIRRACEDDNCDCDGKKDLPLCAADDRNIQIRGKAYPTRRELYVAKEMGDQGIVASLCPQQLTKPDADDYGYRPAVRAITERLERSLIGSCLPRELERRDQEGNVDCLVLAMLPKAGPDSDCERFNLKAPDKQILDQMRQTLRAEEGEEATKHPICNVPQVAVPRGEICKDASTDIRFCYAEAPEITKCAHALAFTKASQELTGARFTMQCIQQTGGAK